MDGDLDWIPSGQAVVHPTANTTWFWNGFGTSDAVDTLTAWAHAAELPAAAATKGQRLVRNAARPWGLFYFDADRTAPSVVAGLGFGPTFDLYAATWDGRKFEPRTFTNPARADENHRIAYDPKRRVLLHFVCTADRATGLAETRVRACDGNDTWRDLPGTWNLSPALACWDATRACVIVCDALQGGTWAWNGAAFALVCDKPEVQWPCSWVSGETHRAAFQLLFGGKRPLLMTMDSGVTWGTEPNHEAGLWSLEATGWQAHQANGLHAASSAVFDDDANAWLLLRADWGPARAATITARLAASGIERHGRVMVQAQRGIVGVNNSFWGGPAHPTTIDREVLRRYAAPVVYVYTQGTFRALEPQLEAPTVGVVASGTTFVSLNPSGGVDMLEAGGAWQHVDADPKPPRREQPTLADGPDGAVLLLGGKPPGGSRCLVDAWLLQDKTWHALKTRGKAPALIDAHAVYIPTLARWLVIGGQDNKYQYSETTWELAGNTWCRYPTRISNAKSQHISLLAWDAPSDRAFIVASGSLYIYDGQGQWRLAGACTGEGVGAYDQLTRTVFFCSGRGLFTPPSTFEVSQILDEAATVVAPNTSPAAGAAVGPTAAEPSVADAVWLRYLDDASDKFWFAAITATGWRTEWGRRGGAKRTQDHVLESPEKARTDYQKKVRAKLAAGYEHAAEGASAALIPGRNAFAFALSKRGEDQFGGVPAGIQASLWPVCQDCQHPMSFVLMLRKHAVRLPLQRHGALALFVCSNTFSKGACQTWEPDHGANRVLLLHDEALRQPALPSVPTLNGLDGSEALAQRRLTYTGPDFEADPEREENAAEVDDASKVGGFPSWIQGDETPTCKQCAAKMTFVAQLEERLDGALNFAGGTGYLFCCAEEHDAKFLFQQ